MVDEIREAIKAQNEIADTHARRYAETDDKEEKAKYEKHTYCRDVLISLLPK